jgi:hypothetical protein
MKYYVSKAEWRTMLKTARPRPRMGRIGSTLGENERLSHIVEAKMGNDVRDLMALRM